MSDDWLYVSPYNLFFCLVSHVLAIAIATDYACTCYPITKTLQFEIVLVNFNLLLRLKLYDKI